MSSQPHDHITLHPEYARVYHHYLAHNVAPAEAATLAYAHTEKIVTGGPTLAHRPPPGNTLVIMILAVLGSLVLCGVTGVVVLRSGSKSGDAERGAPRTSSSPSSDGILYELTGSGRVTVSYGTANGISQQKASLPWSRTEESGGLFSFKVVSLAAQLDGYGSVSCKITIDGDVVAEQSSSGNYAVVTCGGSG